MKGLVALSERTPPSLEMETISGYESPCWFVLNYVGLVFRDRPKMMVDKFNKSQSCDLELFAPTYVVRETKNGEVKMKTINLTFHYVFVRGKFADVKMLCSQNNGFSFLIDRSSTCRYATVNDRDMANFKNIARAYKNCLPYFSLEDIDLEDGDLVEVINGDFPGLTGVYMPKPKSKSGNIILKVFNKVGTIAFDVNAKDVRVLEFSHNSKRANDQLDAIVPHLLSALRYYKASEALPSALVAKLSIFCSRMGVVRLNNHKLDARLQALLYGCNAILGNTEAATQAKSRYEKLKDSVTNEWTRALISLIFFILEHDNAIFANALNNLKILKPTSVAQHILLKEYAFYFK